MLGRIAIAGAGALALTVLGPVALAQTVDGPKMNWRVGAWGKPRAAVAHLEFYKKYLPEQTGGNFTLTIGYESFGGPKELLDILKVGGLEATQICSAYHPDKQPAYTGLDLPFLPLPNADVQAKVHEAYHLHPAIVKEFAGWNAQLFMSTVLPQYEFVGRGKPPKALSDYQGMRVRAIGGIGDAMKRLGAVPTSVDATEVYTSMERGVVDAASFPSTYAHGSYKTYEVATWFTENLSPGTQACPMLVNLDVWNKLPPQYKKLLLDGKAQAYQELKKGYAEADEKNIPLFKKKNLTFIKYTDAELAEFRKIAAQPVWDEWVKAREAQGIPGKELLDLILSTAKQAATN
ncbi:MAG: C4-dicarboxylate ABC transporter substrate-binding protein [Alphaproteobacteria bacterium]|nr:C4-dicarboxylate ABC transporter substrate-binding protein [Alphaproteobacteria bacterium]